MPQLSLKRDDIVIARDKSAIYAQITATNLASGTTDLYSIRLIEEGET